MQNQAKQVKTALDRREARYQKLCATIERTQRRLDKADRVMKRSTQMLIKLDRQRRRMQQAIAKAKAAAADELVTTAAAVEPPAPAERQPAAGESGPELLTEMLNAPVSKPKRQRKKRAAVEAQAQA